MTPKCPQNASKMDLKSIKKHYLKSYRSSVKIFISFFLSFWSLLGRSWRAFGLQGRVKPGLAWERKERSWCTLSAHLSWSICLYLSPFCYILASCCVALLSNSYFACCFALPSLRWRFALALLSLCFGFAFVFLWLCFRSAFALRSLCSSFVFV